MGSAVIIISLIYPSRCPSSRSSPGGFSAPDKALRPRPLSWHLETPTTVPESPPRTLPDTVPTASYRPPTHARIHRPTDGPTDLCTAVIIPRRESWGLTHRLGDSHSSHLCAFVCVKLCVRLSARQWLCFLLLLLLPPSPPSTPTGTRPADTRQLRAFLQSQANRDTPANRLALASRLALVPRTFLSPSSPGKDLLRLSLRNPRLRRSPLPPGLTMATGAPRLHVSFPSPVWS